MIGCHINEIVTLLFCKTFEAIKFKHFFLPILPENGGHGAACLHQVQVFTLEEFSMQPIVLYAHGNKELSYMTGQFCPNAKL